MLDSQDLTAKGKKRLDAIPFPFSRRFPLPKPRRRTNLLLLFLILSLTGASGLLFERMHRLEHKYKQAHSSLQQLQQEIFSTKTLPSKLSHIPFAEDTGLILSVKPLKIRNVVAPYNPSLLISPSGYQLFFRYDILSRKAVYAPFYSRIGVVELDENFEQREKEFQRISLSSEYAEDPRAIRIGEELFLFCNMLNPEDTRCRFMCVANLDPETFATNYVTALDLNFQWIERNWCPFEYVSPDGTPHLFVEYQMSPRKLFELPDPQVNDLKSLILPQGAAYPYLPWTKKWGKIRGGTAAQKVQGEYLSFFHSSFTDENGISWYAMGAYTFQAEPPFAITRMSEYPILFRGIFDSPIGHTGDLNKRVIFPSGFVVERDEGPIRLVCGENDCATKILTIDPEKLLQSMVAFEPLEEEELN